MQGNMESLSSAFIHQVVQRITCVLFLGIHNLASMVVVGTDVELLHLGWKGTSPGLKNTFQSSLFMALFAGWGATLPHPPSLAQCSLYYVQKSQKALLLDCHLYAVNLVAARKNTSSFYYGCKFGGPEVLLRRDIALYSYPFNNQ